MHMMHKNSISCMLDVQTKTSACFGINLTSSGVVCHLIGYVDELLDLVVTQLTTRRLLGKEGLTMKGAKG